MVMTEVAKCSEIEKGNSQEDKSIHSLSTYTTLRCQNSTGRAAMIKVLLLSFKVCSLIIAPRRFSFLVVVLDIAFVDGDSDGDGGGGGDDKKQPA